eukprot:5848996-Amphidinium_carterae.1
MRSTDHANRHYTYGANGHKGNFIRKGLSACETGFAPLDVGLHMLSGRNGLMDKAAYGAFGFGSSPTGVVLSTLPVVPPTCMQVFCRRPSSGQNFRPSTRHNQLRLVVFAAARDS